MRNLKIFIKHIKERINQINSSKKHHINVLRKKFNGKFYHYKWENDMWVSISEDEYNMIKYDNREITINNRELKILTVFLKYLEFYSKKCDKLKNQHMANYLATHPKTVKKPSEIVPEWYRNSEKTDRRIYEAKNGEKVRSKSEMIIADLLFENNINYEYEKPMFDRKVRPDFVITDFEGRTIIWEHFGLMSDPNYVLEAVRKINFYRENGFSLNDNLVVTFEFADADGKEGVRFGSADAEKIIKEYFC